MSQRYARCRSAARPPRAVGPSATEVLESRRLLAGGPAMSGLTLIDADADQPIAISLPRNGTVSIDLNALPTRRLNVRADAGAGARSVRFGLNGQWSHRVESGAPYALASDDAGNYFAWTPAVGRHVVTATAYAGPGAAGAAGDSYAVTLNVIDSRGNAPPPSPAPGGAGTISGRVFADANRNGRPDAGEAGVAGRTVFIDRNYNGQRDANDNAALTDAAGHYAIAGVAASNAYAIRTLTPAGTSQTTPANNNAFWTALAGAATAANVNFGVTTATATPPTSPPPTMPPTVPPPAPSPTLSWPASWQRAADAPSPRFEPVGLAFNGKIYAFGGFKNAQFQVDRTYTSYDPATNRWTNLGTLPAPMAETHNTPVTDGRYLFFVGGYAGDLRHGQSPTQPASNQTWRFDPYANSWSLFSTLPEPVGGGGAAVVGRNLHYFGGTGVDRVTNTGVHYVLNLDAPWAGWSQRAAMPDAKDHFSTAVLNGKVYAIGGEYGHDVAFDTQRSTHAYDPAANRWTRVADLPIAGGHAESSTFVLDGQIVFAGGQTTNQGSSNRVFAYDAAANRWTERTSLPAYRQGAIVAAVGNRVVVTMGATYTVAAQQTTWVGYR